MPRYDGAPIGPGTNLKTSTDQLGSLAHELQPEVTPAAGGHRADIEAPAVIAHLDDPVAIRRRVAIETAAAAAACLRMFWRASWTIRRTTVWSGSLSCSPLAWRSLTTGIPVSEVNVSTTSPIEPSRPSSASSGGRSWLMKPRTSPSSRRSRAPSRSSSWAAMVGSSTIDPADVVDLEDRVRERLGRAVVDLPDQPEPLGLLGLDDPHVQLGRARHGGRVVDQGGVVALEEEPDPLEAARGPRRAG